jgi:imidazolonepropionase
MIRADRIVTGIGDLATLGDGALPRTGSAMSELARVDRGALAVDRGRFVFVGRERDLRREVRLRSTGSRWDARGWTVVPAFVDAHTHALFAGSRHRELELKVRGASYLDIARGGGGLFSTVRATRRASDFELLRVTEARLLGMANSGSLSIEVKSGYALSHAGELRLLELIPRLARRTRLRLVPTFLGAHAVPPEYEGRADAYVDLLIRRTLPAVARRRLASFCDVFCEPGFFTVEQSERLLRAAEGLGLRTKIHADEFVASGGAVLAARLGVTSAEHLLETPEADRAALARAGVTAVLLPITPVASLARSRSLGREFVDAGVPVALGTDLSPNSWVESMGLVLAHAVYGARLTPSEALTAATANAAHAVGLGDTAGQIAVGRPADFLAFDVPGAEHLAYRMGVVPTAICRRGNPLFPPRKGLSFSRGAK